MNTLQPTPKPLFHEHQAENPQKTFLLSAGNTLVTLLVVGFFGAGFARIVGEPAYTGIWKMILMSGTGWLLVMLAANRFMKNDSAAYLLGLTRTMVTGTLPLVPVALFTHLYWGPPLLPFVTILASVGIAFSAMLYLHIKLVRELGKSQLWTAAWALSLLATAATWFLLICETDFSCILQ